MGHMIEQAALQKGVRVAGITEDVCAFDPAVAAESVCIDFTTPDAFRKNFTTLASRFKAVVVGTTGWYDIKDEVFEAFRSSGTTLIWASNFSIGVNAFFAALQKACEVLSRGEYSASVEEIHHIHKLDHPSGTALSLAGQIIDSSSRIKHWAEPQEGANAADAPADTLMISHERRGEVPGIHTITWDSPCDEIIITHSAKSREGFALGAVIAAEWLAGKSGWHTMPEVLTDITHQDIFK